MTAEYSQTHKLQPQLAVILAAHVFI